MIQGPNVKKLICHKMALIMIPPGCGIQEGIKALQSKEGILEAARQATAWVEEAIGVVRAASDPNPWRSATDEEIAQEILKQIQARKLRSS